MIYNHCETIRRRKIFVLVLTSVLLVFVSIFLIKILNPSPNSSPKNLFWSYLTSVNDEDLILYKECIHPVDLLLFTRQYAGPISHGTSLDIVLRELNENLKDSYGSDWFNDIKIVGIDRIEDEKNCYILKYKYGSFKLHSIFIYKYNGKYYLQEHSFMTIH